MSFGVAFRAGRTKLLAAVLLVTGIPIGALLWSAGFVGGSPVHLFTPTGRPAPVAAVLFSGDMGLRYGMGPSTSRFLARHGIEVVGINSPALFGQHRSRGEVDAVVADAVRQGLVRTGARRLVLIGQSFGADVLQTGLARLPADLRGRVAAVVLVVPGESVYFRADPTGISYRRAPDSLGSKTINLIDWAPLTCIYGLAERDSACPAVKLARARIIGMPGGHFLHRNADGLARQVLDAIRRAVPDIGFPPA